MLKMAVLGDKETSLLFSSMGLDVLICPRPQEGRSMLQEAFRKDYGIIFVAESIARECMDIIEGLSEKKTFPIVTIIPDFTGRFPQVAEARLRSLTRRAIGMELPD
jgi:V/A-type H+-transporting ATPase subunit F